MISLFVNTFCTYALNFVLFLSFVFSLFFFGVSFSLIVMLNRIDALITVPYMFILLLTHKVH